MKNFRFLVVAGIFAYLLSSCNLFKRGQGCPTNGKNVGAEQLITGDPKAEKAARKAKKFRS